VYMRDVRKRKFVYIYIKEKGCFELDNELNFYIYCE